jgi:hypothetical protein
MAIADHQLAMRAGDVLWNPLTGEKSLVVESATETGGAIRARIEPALRFEQAILVLWGLCADGRTDAQGRPSPLLGALLATSFRRELRFRRPPAVVQRVVFAALAALARRKAWSTRSSAISTRRRTRPHAGRSATCRSASDARRPPTEEGAR